MLTSAVSLYAKCVFCKSSSPIECSGSNCIFFPSCHLISINGTNEIPLSPIAALRVSNELTCAFQLCFQYPPFQYHYAFIFVREIWQDETFRCSHAKLPNQINRNKDNAITRTIWYYGAIPFDLRNLSPTIMKLVTVFSKSPSWITDFLRPTVQTECFTLEKQKKWILPTMLAQACAMKRHTCGPLWKIRNMIVSLFLFLYSFHWNDKGVEV